MVLLKICGHKVCKEDLQNIFDTQWFEGFSTLDKIHCPVCQIVVNSKDFSKITDLLCKHKFLQKHTIYDTYLPHGNVLRNIVNPGELYDNLHNLYMYWGKIYPDWTGEDDICNETVPSIIYFEKYNISRFNIISELFSDQVSNDHDSYRFFLN